MKAILAVLIFGFLSMQAQTQHTREKVVDFAYDLGLSTTSLGYDDKTCWVHPQSGKNAVRSYRTRDACSLRKGSWARFGNLRFSAPNGMQLQTNCSAPDMWLDTKAIILQSTLAIFG